MIKELLNGIYKALERSDIPLMASDTKEPKSRPGLKIYVKPKTSSINADVRLTTYEIMILYYASNIYDYYLEQYDIIEEFEEMILGSVELSNGVFVDFDKLEFETDDDLLVVYIETTVDSKVDSEIDDEIMEELKLTLE